MSDSLQIGLSVTAILAAAGLFILARARARSARTALLAVIGPKIAELRKESNLIPAGDYHVLTARPHILGKKWTATVAIGAETLLYLSFKQIGPRAFDFQAMDIATRAG